MIVLKILLYAILAVIGAVVLVLVLPTVAEVSYIGEKLTYKVRFSLINLMDSDGGGFLKKVKKKRRKKKVPEKDDNDDDDDFPDIEEDFPEDIEEDFHEECKVSEESEENEIRTEKIRRIKEKKSRKPKTEKPEISDDGDGGKTIGERVGFLLDIWDIGGRPLLKVFRGFHIDKIFIDFVVADEDAYKCAVNYGRVSAVTYNTLAWLGELFTASYKTVDIRSGFSLKKSQWDASCKVSFRLHTLVVSAVWFFAVYLFKIVIPKKKSEKSEK